MNKYKLCTSSVLQNVQEHTQSGAMLTQRKSYMKTYTLQGPLSCHTRTGAHIQRYCRWMFVGGFVMSVFSMEPKHILTLQSFYYHILRYHHSTH